MCVPIVLNVVKLGSQFEIILCKLHNWIYKSLKIAALGENFYCLLKDCICSRAGNDFKVFK